MAQLRLELERTRQGAESARLEIEERVRQEAQQSEQQLRAEAQRAAERLREARKKEQQRRECGICMDNERSVALSPCGHAFCADCVARLQQQGTTANAALAQPCCP